MIGKTTFGLVAPGVVNGVKLFDHQSHPKHPSS